MPYVDSTTLDRFKKQLENAIIINQKLLNKIAEFERASSGGSEGPLLKKRIKEIVKNRNKRLKASNLRYKK